MYTMTNTAPTAFKPARMPAILSSAGAKRGHESRDADPLDRVGVAGEYAKNRTIYYEGDEATHYFKVVSGVVRLTKVTEDGRRQIAAFLTAGDFFGWTGQDTHNYSAEAVTLLTVLKYPRRRVEEIVRSDPVAGRRVLTLLSNQLASAHDHLLLLGRMTAAERIVAFLLELDARQGEAGAATIELPMTRRDIADYLGLTIETVSRTMNALKRKGVISFGEPDSVRLNRAGALERLAAA